MVNIRTWRGALPSGSRWLLFWSQGHFTCYFPKLVPSASDADKPYINIYGIRTGDEMFRVMYNHEAPLWLFSIFAPKITITLWREINQWTLLPPISDQQYTASRAIFRKLFWFHLPCHIFCSYLEQDCKLMRNDRLHTCDGPEIDVSIKCNISQCNT